MDTTFFLSLYLFPKITDTISSIEKTTITFQFKLSCKAPLLPAYNAKPMQPLNHA